MWSIAASCLWVHSEHVTTYSEDTTHIIESLNHLGKLLSVETHVPWALSWICSRWSSTGRFLGSTVKSDRMNSDEMKTRAMSLTNER
jgi:hypothetical protein